MPTSKQSHKHQKYTTIATKKVKNPHNYCSLPSTIFSLSGTLFTSPFLLCFLTFSSLLLIAPISSFLICAAFLITFGTYSHAPHISNQKQHTKTRGGGEHTCLCLSILLISGICLYLSLSASSYSLFSLSRAERMRDRSDACERQRRILPSSEPERRYFVSGENFAEKTLRNFF